MTRGLFLADKSALERRRHGDGVRALLSQLTAEAALATCEVVALEVLYSARNLRGYEALAGTLRAQPWLPVTADATARALEVQHALARREQHRLPIPDLLIAATAEVHQATVLHYDRDFDRIAAVTGQPTQWISPPGPDR